jgi:metal-responsive CopG/Arc/MetJ family transcriptional regulator
MKTIQIVLDERALRAADREARRSRINRSALFRQALAYYLRRRKLVELEERHRQGYEKHPIRPGEFDAWDRALAWPEK